MKVLKTYALSVLFAVLYLGSSAQGNIPLNEPNYNKPKLFADQPEKILVDISDLASLLNNGVGNTVSATISSGFQYNGTVVSARKSEAVESVVIRSSNRVGSAFTLTRVRQADGSTRYIGRIMSLQHGDVFELVQQEGSYYLQKKQLYDMISE